MTDKARPAVGEMSIDAKTLAKVLQDAQPGEIVTYQALGASIGREPGWLKTKGRHLIQTAVRFNLRHHGAVFAVVVNLGYKHLDDKGVVSHASTATRHIRRTARRELERLHKGIKNYEALSPEARQQHGLQTSSLALFDAMTHPKAMEKLEKAIGPKELPLAKMLAAVKEVL
jgi:hypothetical protein